MMDVIQWLTHGRSAFLTCFLLDWRGDTEASHHTGRSASAVSLPPKPAAGL